MLGILAMLRERAEVRSGVLFIEENTLTQKEIDSGNKASIAQNNAENHLRRFETIVYQNQGNDATPVPIPLYNKDIDSIGYAEPLTGVHFLRSGYGGTQIADNTTENAMNNDIEQVMRNLIDTNCFKDFVSQPNSILNTPEFQGLMNNLNNARTEEDRTAAYLAILNNENFLNFFLERLLEQGALPIPELGALNAQVEAAENALADFDKRAALMENPAIAFFTTAGAADPKTAAFATIPTIPGLDGNDDEKRMALRNVLHYCRQPVGTAAAGKTTPILEPPPAMGPAPAPAPRDFDAREKAIITFMARQAGLEALPATPTQADYLQRVDQLRAINAAFTAVSTGDPAAGLASNHVAALNPILRRTLGEGYGIPTTAAPGALTDADKVRQAPNLARLKALIPAPTKTRDQLANDVTTARNNRDRQKAEIMQRHGEQLAQRDGSTGQVLAVDPTTNPVFANLKTSIRALLRQRYGGDAGNVSSPFDRNLIQAMNGQNRHYRINNPIAGPEATNARSLRVQAPVYIGATNASAYAFVLNQSTLPQNAPPTVVERQRAENERLVQQSLIGLPNGRLVRSNVGDRNNRMDFVSSLTMTLAAARNYTQNLPNDFRMALQKVTTKKNIVSTELKKQKVDSQKYAQEIDQYLQRRT